MSDVYVLGMRMLTTNWLLFLRNLTMGKGLSLLEKTLVFVVCPRHVPLHAKIRL
jgi:hypothetical protein